MTTSSARDSDVEILTRIADTISAAFPVADLATLQTVFAPDAVIWHNFDRTDHTLEQNVAMVEATTQAVSGLHYADVRREFFADGFIQQHVLRGRSRDGIDFAVPFCLVVRVETGRIRRIEEYVDSAQLAALAP